MVLPLSAPSLSGFNGVDACKGLGEVGFVTCGILRHVNATRIPSPQPS